jgi:hypothetical protein
MLRFNDGTRARVNHLPEVMAELYSESRHPDRETAEEILNRLEKHSNYIPSSARWEYKNAVLQEYKEYIESQAKKSS